MKALQAAFVLASAAAVAAVAYRAWPVTSTAVPLLPQVDPTPTTDPGMGKPLVSAQQRSIPTAAQGAEEKGNAAESPSEAETQADESGMTHQLKLECLLNLHQMLMEFPHDVSPKNATNLEVGFLGRCVLTIMREDGRADYGDPVELERLGGFSLRPNSPDEWVIAGDRARYRFMKGEFPAYDAARARQTLSRNGEPVAERTPELQATYDALFKEALASLGVTDIANE